MFSTYLIIYFLRKTADFLTTKTIHLSFSIMTALHWFGLKSDYFHKEKKKKKKSQRSCSQHLRSGKEEINLEGV